MGHSFAILMLLKESLIEQKLPAVLRKNTFECSNKSIVITPFGNIGRPAIWRTDQNKTVLRSNQSSQKQCLIGCVDSLNQASSYRETINWFWLWIKTFSSFGKMGHQKIDKIIKNGFPKTSLAKPTISAKTLIVGIKSEFGKKEFEEKTDLSVKKSLFGLFGLFDFLMIVVYITKISCISAFSDWVFVRRNKLCSYG